MCVGGYGIVSVASNIIGNQIKAMMGMVLEGDLERAAAEHRRMLPIFKATRLPMAPADDDFKSRFDPVMDRYPIDLPVNGD